MNLNFIKMTGLFASLFCCQLVHAKIWRVNKNAGINADFTDLPAAFANPALQNGDTIHLEGATVAYSAAGLAKRIVLIGPGYFLSGAGSNAGLQANGNAATMAGLYMDSLASGSVFMGLSGNIFLHPQIDDLTITRCNVSIRDNIFLANAKIEHLLISKSYIDINSFYTFENLYIRNCILFNTAFIPNAVNGLLRNNVFFNTGLTISSTYIANNIFYNSSLFPTNCSIKYNIATNNILPAGNNNQNDINAASVFVATGGTTDGQYKLSTGSLAAGAGEPISGVTPDAGIFGTADPYVLSGIPPVPSIYSLTVPASVPSSATTMTITFSTRSNN